MPGRRYSSRALLGLCRGVCACLLAQAAAMAAGQTRPVPDILKAGEETHTRIYEKLAPAVVGLVCDGRMPNGLPGKYYGTGVVISPEGLMLSNTTVIPKSAQNVRVFFTDGHVRDAKVLRSDAASEGVLLQVEATGLPHMRIADSSKYEVGDPVYSWGNPHFTIQRDGQVSLSLGIISGIYQVSSVDDQSRYLGPAIETDAAVNPGSDGGPLTDAEGHLLGIMSLAFSRTRWLGLSIPTRRLMKGLPELAKLKLAPRTRLSGKTARAWSIQRALRSAAKSAAKATVALVVVRAGEEYDPAANRAQEPLKARKAYPRGPWRAQAEAKRPPLGFSSGFLVEPDGTLVTSAVCLDGKKAVAKIWVFLPDGSSAEAKLLGKDSFYDLAVLKIQEPAGRTFPFAKLAGQAGHLAQGQSVAVLGRSEAPGHLTLNPGRVSATGRFRKTSCQTSALINYGDLGGPVIDLDGRVVGMAAQLGEKTPWRQNCGVGFFLRAEQIAQVLPDLKAGKKIERPKQAFLGVQSARGALDVKGAHVARVQPNGPAAQGGLQDGDVIVAFNGQPVADWLSLVKLIRETKGGQRVKVKIQRGDGTLVLDVTMGER